SPRAASWLFPASRPSSLSCEDSRARSLDFPVSWDYAWPWDPRQRLARRQAKQRWRRPAKARALAYRNLQWLRKGQGICQSSNGGNYQENCRRSSAVVKYPATNLEVLTPSGEPSVISLARLNLSMLELDLFATRLSASLRAM